jgi:hypothetical protein
MYCIMTICSLNESSLPSSNSDWDKDTNLEISKLSEVPSISVGFTSIQKVLVKKL